MCILVPEAFDLHRASAVSRPSTTAALIRHLDMRTWIWMDLEYDLYYLSHTDVHAVLVWYMNLVKSVVHADQCDRLSPSIIPSIIISAPYMIWGDTDLPWLSQRSFKHGELTRIILQQPKFHCPPVAFDRWHGTWGSGLSRRLGK